jgi:peroxiredoxin
MTAKHIGFRVPTTTVYARVRDDKIDGPNPFKWDLRHSGDYFAGRRVVFFSLPGAFTPTCSNSQLPGFEVNYDKFKEHGIDGIICASVNDAFVMNCWFKDQDIVNVEAFPDGNGWFTGSMGMLVGKQHLGFGDRSWRYAMIVNDGIIEAWFEEPGFNSNGSDTDPYGETSPENILGLLEHLKENVQPELNLDN